MNQPSPYHENVGGIKWLSHKFVRDIKILRFADGTEQTSTSIGNIDVFLLCTSNGNITSVGFLKAPLTDNEMRDSNDALTKLQTSLGRNV